MGTDCAPVVANLFLFAYKYEFTKGLLKDNITLATILIGILMTFYVIYRIRISYNCVGNPPF